MRELKAALFRHGIRRAVVSHIMSVRYDAAAGNQALVDALRGEVSLFGAATLVPEMAEAEPWLSSLPRLIAGRVRLVRLFPRSHNFSLAAADLGPLFEAREALRVPLILWHTEATWEEVAGLCGRYHQLQVVVEGTGRKLFYDNRIYYSHLERCPHLYLETHNLTNYLGLDELVRRFGSRRFLFGSFLPHQDPNSAAMPIAEGDMAEEDQRNVAGANLERLIGEVQLA